MTPGLVLAMWSGGVAAGAAVVSYWRIVGPGFIWLAGGVIALLGLGAAFFGGEFTAWFGVILALAATLVARNVTSDHHGDESDEDAPLDDRVKGVRPWLPTAFLGASASMFFVAAASGSPILPLITGSTLLGAMTTLMMLGHWYLVDPQLPRKALLRLDVVAGAGLLADFIYMVIVGTVLEWQPADAILGWTYLALTVLTFLLVVATWYSLQEPSYEGVMAATGLSYLGLLTAFGVVVLGRVLTEA